MFVREIFGVAGGVVEVFAADVTVFEGEAELGDLLGDAGSGGVFGGGGVGDFTVGVEDFGGRSGVAVLVEVAGAVGDVDEEGVDEALACG